MKRKFIKATCLTLSMLVFMATSNVNVFAAENKVEETFTTCEEFLGQEYIDEGEPRLLGTIIGIAVGTVTLVVGAMAIDTYEKYKAGGWSEISGSHPNNQGYSCHHKYWKYKDANSWSYCTGWKKINNKWYYFDNKLAIDKDNDNYNTEHDGWVKLPISNNSGAHERWFWFNSHNDASMWEHNGWYKDKTGRWMYINGVNGAYTNEAQYIDGVRYVFDTNGYMK